MNGEETNGEETNREETNREETNRDENRLWSEVTRGDSSSYKVFFGNNGNLPAFGWIQSCYFCSSPTSRVKLFIYKKTKKLYFFQCSDCKDQMY